jgi:hypothetical protein
MSDYENEYANFLIKTENGKKPLERSDQVKMFYRQLEKEEIKDELIYQAREKEMEDKAKDDHFRLWSDGAVDDQSLDDLFGNKR